MLFHFSCCSMARNPPPRPEPREPDTLGQEKKHWEKHDVAENRLLCFLVLIMKLCSAKFGKKKYNNAPAHLQSIVNKTYA